MTEKKKISSENTDLRRRAEEMLLKRHGELEKIPPADVQRMVHELRVHQIELEMQNDELRRTQQELEAAREKYFDLYDLAPVGYFTLNEKGLILEANLTAAALLGEERSHLIGQPITRFIIGEDQDIFYLCHKQLVETRENQTCLIRMATKEVSPVWVRIDMSITQDIDGAMRFRAVIIDISESKRLQTEIQDAREYAENIVENVREPLVVLNSDLKIITANRSFYDTFKVVPEETIGNFIYDLGNRQWDIPKLRVLIEEILPSDTVFNGYEVEHDFLDIGRKVILLNARQIFRENIGSHIILLAMEDITVRRQAEDEMKKASELSDVLNLELEAANEELEAFSYSVSHDLRAPLRYMRSFAGLLQKRMEGQPDEKSRQFALLIFDSAKQMERLIDDLLAFSHIGRAEMKKSKVSLSALTSEVVRECQNGASNRDIAWDIAQMPDVSGDRAMLRLVLVNLISNAIKFTNIRPRAEIAISCEEGEGEFICSVKDNGAGFDMKQVDRLFGVFQRLHAQSEFEGTGIGLANVRRIISRHGGRTWAEGSPGQGAKFYFTIPKPKELIK